MRMIVSVLLLILCCTIVQVNTSLENIFCSLSSSNEIMIENVPKIFELNVPYTVILSSNNTLLLTSVTLDIDTVESVTNKSNSSFCSPKNKSISTYIHKTEFVIKFEKNSTKTKCIQLRLQSPTIPKGIQIADLCTNSSTDKIIDNDDKYDLQSYMRTINTTEIALLDNFNWLIFGPRVQQIWYTHEGMRLSRECDAAEDGRVAIFNNPRGKRRLISRPIDVSNASLLYLRLGSGTCPPPASTDPPFQVLITTDCLNYSNWQVVYSHRILSDIEYVTVPLSLNNLVNTSIVCLKIEQNGDKFLGSSAWFIDDLLIIRSRLQNEFFSEIFQAMKPANWYRLAGGHLKTCDGRMSMVFESNSDIRTELGATTIDISLPKTIDYHRDVLFHLSKNISIDWTKWNATGVLDLNKTCTDDDVITFNGENYRQLCSPTIELGKIDSVRFTLSIEPCTKQNKSIPTPNAVIFLTIFYNGSTVGYSRTIRRILLSDIKQVQKTFHIRFDELHHDASSFGRICLSQYHQSSEKNIDVWSVRDFLALPPLQTNITHYIQFNLNTQCSLQQITNNGGVISQSINIEYSVDFGKNWHLLLQPCFLDSTCSIDVQHVYSSKIILPSSGWHRITLPLPMATLQQEYIRFRLSIPPSVVPMYSWAIDRIFIGQCYRACSGHGWCQFNSCRCDPGFSGDFCEISNSTLFNRGSFLMDNQTDLMNYQGGRLSYKCDIISQGKALVFSKIGFRLLRISNINGSSPKLLEFTLRLGSTNTQCYGTSKTDLDRDLKSILLLSSCSNGVHWTIIDRFGISNILAPDFGTMSRILFATKPNNEHCLIEWRQMTHRGDNQDVWAIDDITIRDVIPIKSIPKNLHMKNYQTKLIYIRPGFILTFRLESLNRKEFNFDDIRLQINSSQIDLSTYGELFSYQSENSILTFILTLPRSIWFQYIRINFTVISTKKFDLNLIHLGVQCEDNCWLNGFCFEGICLNEKQKLFNQSINRSFNEDDLIKYKINLINEELLLPLIDSIDLSAIHFQTISSVINQNKLIFECSPNGGMTWFELGLWIEEKENSLKDHYVSLSAVCQAKQTLFRWRNTSIRLINVAFVKSQIQYYFMDQFQKIDSSKWLYPTYSLNSSGLSPKKIRNFPSNKTIFQLISTAITLKQHNSIIMIDTKSNLNNIRLQIDYSIDNVTWHSLIDTKNFERSMNRFGQQIPTKILRSSILLRIQSDQIFVLNHIYLGPPCPANCYGHGKCLWEKQQTVCQCDKNQTLENNCLPTDSLFSSLYETFENKYNSSLWKISSHVQITHRCYNRQSKTTPYLCFLPNNHTQRAYAMVGPFKTIKYVLFKFGLQYMNLMNCSNEILFQYSYDNGIQWFTRKVLDETNNIFEKFDDISLNENLYLRWIEDNHNSCLMWNLRSISIRTKYDDNIWFENRTNIEYQTWEFPLIHSSLIIQFNLQMFSTKKTNSTNWELILEISSDIMNGWSNWLPLIPSCNQSNLYCDERISITGSVFLAQLYEKQRNVTIPIPDNYVNQEVRFRWITSQTDAKFTIKNVYIGADCPWFCSGHGLCQSNGCLCHPGYVLPFCSPDPLNIVKGEISAIQLNANLSIWSDRWGYEKCSVIDERLVFSRAGTRGLISPEISLIGIKYLRIQLDTCFNQTLIFIDPIYVQISMNNGILWQTLMTIIYRREFPHQPWIVEIPNDETMKLHLIRIRLYQRVTTKWNSNWILNKFEMIPEKLPNRWISNPRSLNKICNYKNYIFPLEIYSTIDIELNETSFLTFQLDANPCMTGSPVSPNRSQFNLEYSIDYGQSWSSIDRPSTFASNTNDLIITEPFRGIQNIFYLPLHAYRPLSKFIRIRWIAINATIATRWLITNVTIRSECEILCELEVCNSKCRCLKPNNCTTKTTFFERFNSSSQTLLDVIILPPLNLVSTRFLEFHLDMTCKQTSQIISLEYSRNLGLSWQLFKYYTLNINQSYIIHEDLIDEIKYDYTLIRFVFLSNISKCLKFEQIIVSGTNIIRDIIYGKFDRSNNFDRHLFLSFGDGIFNGTYLIYSSFNKTNSTTSINELITDDMNIFEDFFYIQLSLIPLLFNHCINIQFSYSSDYGYTWQSLDHDDILFFDDQYLRKMKIFTWKFPSKIIGTNQVRFRIRFNDEQFHIGISELYIGSNCINACHAHGMCSPTGRCRCDLGWTNNDCSLSLIQFPNEIDILKYDHYTSYGTIENKKCGRIFNNTCKREFQTNFLDINHENSFIHIELNDQCISKTMIRKNADGWIRLQYREINTYQWITLHTFKGYEVNLTILLPAIILQFRLIQDYPIQNRSPWSIEQFYFFYIHSSLQWLSWKDQWNSTFLTLTNQLNNEILYETKDIYFHPNSILQIEFNDTNIRDNPIEYSVDLGLTWLEISNENQLKFLPIKFHHKNITIYRLTIVLNLFSTIRFRFKRSHLHYTYVGNQCPMNCYGHTRCMNGECQINDLPVPLIDFREIFDKDFQEINWLQFEKYQQETNQIFWTTTNRQAITKPIDLRSIRTIKWTYVFKEISKTCQTSIYFLISTDGTLTWSILHQFDFPMKNLTTSIEVSVDLESIKTKYQIGQFRWYQPVSSKCNNFTWGLSKIISIKSINIYFLTDYFYTISSSRSNWESIDGALLAHSDACNNNLSAFIFDQNSFSVTTVPILIQSFYVLVFQVNSKCNRNPDAKNLQCRNITSSIEYRSESSLKWFKLADMADLACRTSLINGGYFNIHTIKLPLETYSSGTQFRWIGTQAKGVRWSMNSLFIGECPEYCHDRGLCTITGCQCVMGYSGTYCEKYVGNESLLIWFNETFDDLSVASGISPNSNNWIKLSGDGHIRHVCDENLSNNTNNYLSGQALHFGAGCGCGSVEAITRELNISQATTISFAFHVTTEDNCVSTINNITVALEWTYDEGISWKRLVTMYNQEHAQFFNLTLPSDMMVISEKRIIGGIRFRWTQIERGTNDTYWAIDNIRLE